MSQNSLHGKWAVSSSDDDDGDELPSSKTVSSAHPTGVTDSYQNTRPPVSSQSSNQIYHAPLSPDTVTEVKDEPDDLLPEADVKPVRPNTSRDSQSNPKYESPLSGKRKKDQEESGWALSDSDGDDDVGNKANNPTSGRASSPKAKKPKVEISERPPSPYGRQYYINEPDDFFETHVPCLNDTYRFYLNKVTGLDKKYNTGALHIRGESLVRFRVGQVISTLNVP